MSFTFCFFFSAHLTMDFLSNVNNQRILQAVSLILTVSLTKIWNCYEWHVFKLHLKKENIHLVRKLPLSDDFNDRMQKKWVEQSNHQISPFCSPPIRNPWSNNWIKSQKEANGLISVSLSINSTNSIHFHFIPLTGKLYFFKWKANWLILLNYDLQNKFNLEIFCFSILLISPSP